MDTEHQPEMHASESVIPLSLLFAEITPDEATLLDGETVRIMERRSRVIAHYRNRATIRQIATELNCSLGTVHHDIHAVLAGYKRIADRSAKELIADMLQHLAHREAEIEADLERSRGESQETTTSRRSTDGAGQGQAVVKRKTKYGDPRLHALLLDCWDRRCKLLALLSPAEMGQGAVAAGAVGAHKRRRRNLNGTTSCNELNCNQ